MNNSIASNVLDAIDNIDVVTQESDLSTYISIYEQLMKQDIILEEYMGDELEGFSIFQEGEILDEVNEKGKNEGAISRAVKFLPRLIMALVNAIKKKVMHTRNQYNIKKADEGKELSKKAIESIRKEKKASPVYKLIVASSIACGVTAAGTLIFRIKKYGPAVEFKDDVNFQIADDLSEIRVQFPFYKIEGMKKFNSEFNSAFEKYKNSSNTSNLSDLARLFDNVVTNQARISERDFTIESWDKYYNDEVCGILDQYADNLKKFADQFNANGDRDMSNSFTKRIDELVKKNKNDLELITVFHESIHKVFDILSNPDSHSKFSVNKAKKMTYKPLVVSDYVDMFDIDTSNLAMAIKLLSRFISECPMKSNLNAFAARSSDYIAAMDYLGKQFNCKIKYTFSGGGGATLPTFSLKGKEGSVNFYRNKGFDLGGATIVTFNDIQYCYDKAPDVAGQMHCAIMCHEIFHNIAMLAGIYGGKIYNEFKRCFDITSIAVKIATGIFRRAFGSYAAALNISEAEHKDAFDKTINRFKHLEDIIDDPNQIKEFMEKVARDEDNISPSNSGDVKDTNLNSASRDIDLAFDEYSDLISSAISTIVARFNLMVGGALAIASMFSIGSNLINYKMEHTNEETMCDMCAALYKLPIHISDNVKTWIKNKGVRDQSNGLGKFDVHSTTMSRETMSYNIAKQLLNSGKVTDPDIIKYLSHIVSTNKGINKTENKLSKMQIKHLAPEFMEDFNKGMSKWLAKNNLPPKRVKIDEIV